MTVGWPLKTWSRTTFSSNAQLKVTCCFKHLGASPSKIMTYPWETRFTGALKPRHTRMQYGSPNSVSRWVDRTARQAFQGLTNLWGSGSFDEPRGATSIVIKCLDNHEEESRAKKEVIP
ncbi:hypothetical protein T265_04678 [Opisthorchis viverrini]|uniref:Uncharacterized protein n=1 Tax=Opisthorchis viverrini TaxID=6198 RepID=A0A074ZYY9_OPIVI|nr:hypothetical protein T265_04678 [Opisthorchis viverrini]KER28545.1 hypothetical protein T265_04678 [Opisthorchis viverrini]